VKLRNGEHVLIGNQEFVFHETLKDLFSDLRTHPIGSGRPRDIRPVGVKDEQETRKQTNFGGNKEAD